MEVEISKKEIHFRFMIALIIFLLILVMSLFSSGINTFLGVLSIICICLGIYHFLAYINQKIIFSNDGIKFLNFINQEKIYSWEEILYKVQKKQFQKKSIGGSYYRRKYDIKNEYTFFVENKKIFCLNEDEFLPAAKDIFERAIKTNRLKEDKPIIDGEEVTILKPILVMLFLYLFMFVILTFLVFIIFVGLASSLQGEILLTNIIFVSLDIYYFICILKEIEQLTQKVYFIENQGFYKVLFGNKEYYDFSEIDNCVIKRYLYDDETEYKATLYKDNQKILTITNSNKGFYDFLDEIRYKDIDENRN